MGVRVQRQGIDVEALGRELQAKGATAFVASWRSLLDRGVLIRQTGPSGWLRVSVGTPQENDMFRSALLEATGRAPSALDGPDDEKGPA